MKHININAHSILSLLISCSVLLNTTLPAFSQVHRSSFSNTQNSNRFPQLQADIVRKSYEAVPDALDTNYLEQQFRITQHLDKLNQGSLTQVQLSRLTAIKDMFSPRIPIKNEKTDFEQFEALYSQRLEQEFAHEKQALQDSRKEIENNITSNEEKYRGETYHKELYVPLIKKISNEASKNNQAQSAQLTTAAKTLSNDLQDITLDSSKPASEQLQAIVSNYPAGSPEAQLLTVFVQNIQIQEEAVKQWRKQADTQLKSWYTQNLTKLNQWKKDAQTNTKQIFEKEYQQKLLQAREEEVKKAVADLWAYKGLGKKAHYLLLTLAPTIAQLRTLDGKSFFTKAQIDWLNAQYLQVLQKSTCGEKSSAPDACSLEMTAISGLGMLTNSREAAYAIEQFMTAKRKTPYAVPALLTGTVALLSMEQYRVLNGFLHTATRDERSGENIDILSVENLVNSLANVDGQYLGEISKYAQYPLHENPNDQTAMGNAWEDVAQILADKGTPEALALLREYGPEKCLVYEKTTLLFKTEEHLQCTGIIPFLVGALASGKSGADQYNPTSVLTRPGYVMTNRGNIYISPEDAKRNADKLVGQKRAFFQHAKNMGLSNTAAIIRHLFLQSMGDLSAESELRVDNQLYQAYKSATKNKTPKPEFAITSYTRNSAQYNAKRARQDRTQIFRKISRVADWGILIWCLVDITKWSHSGVKVARAISKASRMARQGATVAQRAVMLRNLNIAPKLRSFVNIPGKIKNGMSPVVLAERPLFTSQVIELPKFAGFAESAGTIAANTLRFSAETGALSIDVAAMEKTAYGTLSNERIASFNTMLGQVSSEANTQFANRSIWQRLGTFNKNRSYRSLLSKQLMETGEKAGFTLAELNPMRYQISMSPISVPKNIDTFKVPSLLQNTTGMPSLSLPALTRVATASLGHTPTTQQLSHTQSLFNAALADTNAQFLNRNWFSRQWNFLRRNNGTKYKNLLLDNLAAQFDKDGLIFTNPEYYNLYRSLVSVIENDKELQTPAWLTQLNYMSMNFHSEKFHTMGATLFKPADSSAAPQELPLLFQMQRKRFWRGGIRGVESNSYQRVVISTDKKGSLLFGFGNNLNAPVKPSQFKLTLEEPDVPALLRAAENYTGEPLQLKLTSTNGKWPWHSSFYSNRWTAFQQSRLDGKFFPIVRSLFRGKNNMYVHDIPVQIRLADGSLKTLPVVFKSDSYLGLRHATAILENSGKLAWYQDGQLLTQVPKFSFGLPKHQIAPFLNVVKGTNLESPLRLTGLSGKNKIEPLMWATGLSLSSASTGLIAPLENVYGNNITEGEKTLISLAFPYLPSLAAPLFSPLVMKIGALRTLQIALGVSTAGLFFTTYKGFSGELDKSNLPPIWPLYVSGAAIGISSALSRSGLNLLIDSMGGGGTLLKSMAYKNIGSFALLLPPFAYNFIKPTADFSFAFPVLGTLSALSLSWVSASRISTQIGKVDGFMKFKPLHWNAPKAWLPTLGSNTLTALSATHKEAWSTVRLLSTKQVLPLVLAATAFTGFEAGAFSKAGNQMIRPNLQKTSLPSWVPETNRNNYVAMLTNLSVIMFPLVTRLTAKPVLKLMETGKAGDEYRRMLQASFALNTAGVSLLYANGFNGYNSLGMLGIGLMGMGTANMTQSFQKLSNISVKTSSYARMLTRGLVGAEKEAMEKSLVTKTMTGFPVQQLGIAIVPTIVSAYTDRQIAEGSIQKSDAAHSSLWIPVTSLALCFGASASNIGLFPGRIPTGMVALTKGLFGSYSGAVQQLQQPQFYLSQPLYGVPTGFSPIPTSPTVNLSEIIPSKKKLEQIEDRLEQEQLKK